MKTVLHVGCGPATINDMPKMFHKGWKEERLDIDPGVSPDIVSDMCDMKAVNDNSFDAIYSSHNLEHLYYYQVPIALSEFFRVIKTGGSAFITLPDIQQVARVVAEGNIDETLYESPMGPITPLDILYGHGASLQKGNHYMAHKIGFTSDLLERMLFDTGFTNVSMNTTEWNLWAVAKK